MSPRPAAALLALLLAGPAAASQFAVPLHVPPRVRPAPGPVSFELGVGWLGARAPGLAVEGLGGGWELAGSFDERTSGHLHADAFGLSGRGEPLAAGGHGVVGMTGSLEADLGWSPDGPEGAWRLYGGGLVNLTVLSFAGTGTVVLYGGQPRAEPDTAVSLVYGLPVGASARWRARRSWAWEAGAHLTGWLGGRTRFTYAAAGPLGQGGSRRVDPSLGGGVRLRVEHLPSTLALEAGGSLATASGGNEGLAIHWARLTVRFQ